MDKLKIYDEQAKQIREGQHFTARIGYVEGRTVVTLKSDHLFYDQAKHALDTEARVDEHIANIEKKLERDDISVDQREVFEGCLKMFQGILHGDKPTGEEVIE